MRSLLYVLAMLLAACVGGQSATTTTTEPTPASTQPSTAPTTSAPATTTTEMAATTTLLPPEATWGTWSLILASVPVGADAEGRALALAEAVPGSGVLLSDDFPSLNPGYWVVFLGAFDTRPGTEACPSLPDGYTCYPRYLGDTDADTAFVLVGSDLVEIDTTTGTTLRTVKEWFSGDGVYRGGFELSPDRKFLYFSEGWEDSWFSCESSPGAVGRIDLATGEETILWTGTAIAISADGNFAAYLEASQCLPDPEEPDFWVLTPYDTVVVVDLRIMEPAMMTSQALPSSYDDPNSLRAVAFHPDGDAVVLGEDGILYKVPLGSAAPIQSHPQILTGITAYAATVAGNALLTIEWNGDEGDASEIELRAHDLTTGAVSSLLTAPSWIEVGVSPSGAIIAAFENQVYPHLDNPFTTSSWVGGIDW